MLWKISIVKLPLPKYPLSEGGPTAPHDITLRNAQTEAEALNQCHELVEKGYCVEVTGPNNAHLDHEEILRRLAP